MRVEEEPRRATQHGRARQKGRRLDLAAAAEAGILSQHCQIIGHPTHRNRLVLRLLLPSGGGSVMGQYQPMVAISLLSLSPGRMGGTETYVRDLTRSLAHHGSREYLVAVPDSAPNAGGGLPAVTCRGPRLARMIVPPRRFRGAGVVHFPLTIPFPAVRGSRVVVTLHDVLHLDVAHSVPRHVKWFRRVAYDLAARNADLVIVPSEFVRRRAMDLLHLDPSRIRVVHHGVDHELFRPGTAQREQFLLYPARPWPHKNHLMLFDAFRRVRSVHPAFRLVLTGGGHEGMELPEGVHSMGLVPSETLASLYRRAAAVVVPSRYEGFGLPALEAMASGAPVAVASGTALEEVVGDGGVIFSASSADEVAEGILRVLEIGASLRDRALEIAAAYTLEAMARLHDAAYRELE
jgi:glycosyltransferase involved in cell wall biosynthesis